MGLPDKIRLLIVDDFEVIRRTLERLLEGDEGVEVVGMAGNGQEGLEMVQALRPDVVLMDLRMPVMDGMTALKAIMAECPTPVLVVSAFAAEGAEETLAALEAGAVDFVPKLDMSGNMKLESLRGNLLAKIRAAAGAKLDLPTDRSAPVHLELPAVPERTTPLDAILIGTSTGGPKALQVVLPQLPADLPAGVVVVQHMPPTFTPQLADRLNKLCALEVREAVEGDAVSPGKVLLAPGDRHLVFRGPGRVGLDEEPADTLHRPSVDVMARSGAEVYGSRALGIVLTGMGQDGAMGMAALKERGGAIIAQDEATCVVYGMPRAVVEAGLADEIRPLGEVAAAILRRFE